MDLHFERLPRTVELVKRKGAPVFCYVDQRRLPGQLVIEETQDWREVISAIKTLAVRGAPAIGVAGAAALALWAAYPSSDITWKQVAACIASARPTAVNLSWAINRAQEHCASLEPQDRALALFDFVKDLEALDEQVNRRIGDWGAELLGAHTRVLTHCNAGSLATCFYGTALGVVYSAASQGKIERVYADETRPVGQGARLTVWELSQVGIPTTLLCDNMAASLMASGEIDAVIVGADRIARNGDVANKIGTYGLAVLAQVHSIPFYVAAPISTFDPNTARGSDIVIEQRNAEEVLPHPISGVDVINPAFDVTPAHLISKVVTENGAFSPKELQTRL